VRSSHWVHRLSLPSIAAPREWSIFRNRRRIQREDFGGSGVRRLAAEVPRSDVLQSPQPMSNA
jgi:hypothetical protein